MGFLSDIIGGIFGNEAADKQADAIVNAQKGASQTQLEMFNRAVALNEPYRQAGINALGAQGALLGYSNLVPQSAVASSMAANGNGGTWQAYGQANPDVMQFWQANPNMHGQFGNDINRYLKYHYENYGQNEGRKLPGMASAGSGGNGSIGYAGTPEDAYGAFENSGFAKSMLETTNSDFDRMVGSFGAAGNALSGSAIGALDDRNRRNTSSAFNNYYNALSGISNTGANIGSQQGDQAIATGNNIAQGQINSGYARGSSYAQQGQNNANMVNGGVNALAAWFGGQ
jgi:hypothetical protein